MIKVLKSWLLKFHYCVNKTYIILDINFTYSILYAPYFDLKKPSQSELMRRMNKVVKIKHPLSKPGIGINFFMISMTHDL